MRSFCGLTLEVGLEGRAGNFTQDTRLSKMREDSQLSTLDSMIRSEAIRVDKPDFNGKEAYFNALLLCFVMLRLNELVTFQDIVVDRDLIDWTAPFNCLSRHLILSRRKGIVTFSQLLQAFCIITLFIILDVNLVVVLMLVHRNVHSV